MSVAQERDEIVLSDVKSSLSLTIEADELRDENERLRVALENIRDSCSDDWAWVEADRALKETP